MDPLKSLARQLLLNIIITYNLDQILTDKKTSKENGSNAILKCNKRQQSKHTLPHISK